MSNAVGAGHCGTHAVIGMYASPAGKLRIVVNKYIDRLPHKEGESIQMLLVLIIG